MKKMAIALFWVLPSFAAFPDICVKCWYEVPNSILDSVYQSPRPPGWGGENAIMGENGGVYDTRRNRLIVMGGGGSDYAGNEVYAFSLDSLKWERIKDAATYFDDSDSISGYYFNGGAVPDSQQPRPAYNFDQIEYDSITDNVFLFGQSFCSWYGTTWPNILQLNLGTLTWHQPGTFNSEFHGGNVSARHPGTGKIWFYGNGTAGWLSEFDPATGTVTDHGDMWNSGNWINTNQNAAIMPPKDRMISIGSGQALYWDVATSGYSPPHDLPVTGCDSLMAVDAPGFEWSPADHKMVGWAGGGRVVTMDTTYTCTVEEPSDSNTVIPEDPQLYGTYGRWRYVPKYNVFVVVSTETGHVYLYRHSAGTGSDSMPTPPAVVITSPAHDTIVRPDSLWVRFTVDAVSDSQKVGLAAGPNQVIISRTNAGGTGKDTVNIYRDTVPPVVVITSPPNGKGFNSSPATIAWTVDGITQTTLLSQSLSEGANTVTRTATDSVGNTASASIQVYLDTHGPAVAITSPDNGYQTNQASTAIAWTVDGTAQTTELTASLAVGSNKILRSAADSLGNIGKDSITVIRDTTRPVLYIVAPSAGFTSSSASVFFDVQVVAGTVQEIHLRLDGEEYGSGFSLASGHYTATRPVGNGHHVFLAYASNAVGTSDTVRTAFVVDTLPAATEVEIRGKIVNASTLNGIPGVNVKVRETNSLVTTGSDGIFTLPSGGFGKFKLDVAKSGYASAVRFVSADSGLDVYLPTIPLVALDTHFVHVPAGKDTSITLADSKVQVDFPTGAISSATNVSATVFNHISQLPNEQPNQEIFLFGVELQPEGAVFGDSLTIKVANQNRLTAGADVPITYFNKTSGLWEDVGTGYVTPDAQYIQFKTNHFSTFHGNRHYASGAATPGENAAGAPPDPPTCPAGSATASFVSMPNGDLQLDYTVPGGPAFTDLDVRLVYWSSAANPRKVISSQLDDVKLTPAYLSWTLDLPGSRKQWLFYGPTGPSVLNYVWPGKKPDGTRLETGLYAYGIRMVDVLPAGSYRYDVAKPENLYYRLTDPANVTNYFYGYTTLVNRSESPYGAGWAVEGVTRIVKKKNTLTGYFPATEAYRGVDDFERHSAPFGGSTVSRVGVSTALNAVGGTLEDDHVSIVGAGTDGHLFWRVPGTNRYTAGLGSHDSLVSSDSGWIRRRVDGTVESYDANGLLKYRMDNKGRRQLFAYDPFGERILRIKDSATGAKIEFQYDEKDRLSGIKDQFGRITRFSMDANGDLREIVAPDGIVERAFTYDSAHRAKEKFIPGGAHSEYAYDSLGGIIQTKSPEGLITTFNTRGNFGIVNGLATVASGVLETFFSSNVFGSEKTYKGQPVHALPKASGERKSFQDNLGGSNAYVYNTFGLIANETNAKGEITRFEYDTDCGCGQAAKTTYPNGNEVSYLRDGHGNILRTHDSFTGATTSYEYVRIKDVDRLKKTINPAGLQTKLEYDSLGNLIRAIAPGPDTTTIGYNSAFLPETVTDPAGKTAKTLYDSLGRVKVGIGGRSDTTLYAYDGNGNLQSVRDPMGRTAFYTYDPAGRLLQALDPAGNVTRYKYDAFGRLDTLTDPQRHITRFLYDSAGRMTQTINHLGIGRHYAYDAKSNLVQYVNGRGQALEYRYDALQRLTAKINPDQSILSRFGYDAMGNMVYAGTQAYAVNRRYDLAGRMLQEEISKVRPSDTITGADTIRADDFSRDYTRMIVKGGHVVIDGSHHFSSLKLINGATAGHLPTDTSTVHRMDLSITDSLVIDSSSSLDLTGLGYLGADQGNNTGALGRTDGNTRTGGSSPGSGGSHGGRGGRYLYAIGGTIDSVGFAAAPYDDRLNPVLPGGGAGGLAASANGGGVLLIQSPFILLNGSILAKGQPTLSISGGGGGGGSVNIVSDSLKGSGAISVAGGNGVGAPLGGLIPGNPAGGGGGRILVKAKYFGVVDYSAGGGTNGGQDGTIALIGPDSIFAEEKFFAAGFTDTINADDSRFEGKSLILDGASLVVNGKHRFHSLVLKNNASLTHSAASDTTENGMEIEVDRFIKIDSTSAIDASEKGYRGGRFSACAVGPGFLCGARGSNGGSYGDVGGEVSGNAGAPYGSPIAPVDFGSGGGCEEKSPAFSGGYGGGRISLKAQDILIDGNIQSNGGNGMRGGGGSGGSIYLMADSVYGKGFVAVRGGSSLLGGGGSGGRIAVLAQGSSLADSSLLAYGGLGVAVGGNGSIYLGHLDTLIQRGPPPSGAPLVISGDSLIIRDADLSFDDRDIAILHGKVSVTGNHRFRSLRLTHSEAILTGKVFVSDSLSALDTSSLSTRATDLVSEGRLDLVVAGKVRIDATSKADVSGLGYWGDHYLTGGYSGARTAGNKPGSHDGAGGGYGGKGGGAWSASENANPAYGSAFMPNDLGSGGGVHTSYSSLTGGNGGGALRIWTQVGQIDGEIQANGLGGSGSYASYVIVGGGSGGSILISADTLAGSGRIFAKGGAGQGSTSYGNGGGGGRIALYPRVHFGLDESRISAEASQGGKRGTVVIARCFGNADSLLQFWNPASVSESDSITAYMGPNDTLFDHNRISLVGNGLEIAGNHAFKGVSIANSNVICKGSLSFDSLSLDSSLAELTDSIHSNASISFLHGTLATHKAATHSAAYKLILDAAKRVYVDATSKLDLSGRGYRGAKYLGGAWQSARTLGNANGSRDGAGGGYGGRGGPLEGSVLPSYSNPTYGDMFAPFELGSGGGVNTAYSELVGGNGGGAVKIRAQCLLVDGRIVSTGGNGTGSVASYRQPGGGSGGAIYVRADSIYGTGSLHANGGRGDGSISSNGLDNGGGGGRIALYSTAHFGMALDSITALGTDGGERGSAVVSTGRSDSVVYFPNTGATREGDFISGGIGSGDTRFDHHTLNMYGNGLSISGTHHFRKITAAYSNLLIGGAVTIDTLILDHCVISGFGPNLGTGDFSHTQAAFNSKLASAGNLNLLDFTTITAPQGSGSSFTPVHLEVNARLRIDSTSRIDVSGKGYPGTFYSGSWNLARCGGDTCSTDGAGASHGGKGGEPAGGKANSIYGDPVKPDKPGSGGGATLYYTTTRGGNGGGLVKLICGSIRLEGGIYANGENGTYGDYARFAGGGSGGGVYLEADSLTGSGLILARGGSGVGGFEPNPSNGGGGGRVALAVYQYMGYAHNSLVSVDGSGGASSGSLTFVSSVADSTVTFSNASAEDSNVAISTYIEADNTRLDGHTLDIQGSGIEIHGDHQFRKIIGDKANLRIIGNVRIDSLMTSHSRVEAFGNLASQFQAFTASNVSLSGIDSSATDIDIKSGSLVTHSPANDSQSYWLILKANRKITVDSTSAIDLQGKGYVGGYHNGVSWRPARTYANDTGSRAGAGGGYGGNGGKHSGSLNKPYGNLYYPNELGSGGAINQTGAGAKGGSGGGYARLVAPKIVIKGVVASDGTSGNPTYSTGSEAGGGSGGGILLVADSIQGTGSIRANGGSGAYGSNLNGGGGGRIAAHANLVSDSLAWIAHGVQNGGAGTVFIRDGARPNGLLLVDNQDESAPDSSTVLPGLGQGFATGLAADTLMDSTAQFSGFMAGHYVKLNYGLASPGVFFKILSVSPKKLRVDASSHTLLEEGDVGDPYSGIYVFDSVSIIGGARVSTKDQVFYSDLYLNNGHLASYNGILTGLILHDSGSGEPYKYPRLEIKTGKIRNPHRGKGGPGMRELEIGLDAEQKKLFGYLSRSMAQAKPKSPQPAVASSQPQAHPAEAEAADTAQVSMALGPIEEAPVPHSVAWKNPLVCANSDPIFEYDPLGRRTAMITPAGTTSYAYDSTTGQLKSITTPSNGRFDFGISKGRLESLDFPNGISARYTFDSGNNLTRLAYLKAGDTLQSHSYTYSASSMRTSMSDEDGTHQFTYDAIDQLIRATHPRVADPLEKFGYDSSGNIAFKGDSTHLWSYDGANQLLQNDSDYFHYDDDGNMVRKINKATGDTTRFTFDIENRTIEMKKPGTTSSFDYDALGRRVKKSVNGLVREFRYDGDDLVLELNGNDSILASYSYGPGIDWTLQMRRGNANYYYLRDGLGSVVSLANSSGAIVRKYQYGVYGELVKDSGNVENPFTYTSREREAEFGLYFHRARYFDPQIGRWTTKDPIGFEGGNVNLYAYVSNDPINLIDPYGLYDMMDFREDAVNFSAGLGDALLLGFGDDLRSAFGVEGVDECAGAYAAGSYAALAAGVARLGYAAAAKGISVLASSGAAASAGRAQLKNIARLGLGKGWRLPNLAGKSDAALRASAGRTNSFVNAYGAGVAAAGAAGAGSCGCKQ